MIKFDKNEFLKPQIYSTLDEYETRCNVTEEIIKEIEQLQQENEILQEELEKYKNPIKYFKYASKNVTDENKKLKDNWNKLKEYLENKIDEYSINLEYLSVERMAQIKNKMQELEQGSDSDEI